jgi:hypothetical protein
MLFVGALTIEAASFIPFWGNKNIAESVLKRPKHIFNFFKRI